MMKLNEISRILKRLQLSSEILFVVDSMTIQDNVNSAKTFNDVLDLMCNIEVIQRWIILSIKSTL